MRPLARHIRALAMRPAGVPPVGRPAVAAGCRRSLIRAWRTVASFGRSEHGGAIAVTGAFVIIMMTGAGAWMSNYAWREAQWEELNAAARAAVSVAGPLLAGAGGTLDDEIKARVADFVAAALPDLDVEAANIEVTYDAAEDTVTVVIHGHYDFDTLWVFDAFWVFGDGAGTAVDPDVKVRLEYERYEVVMALDVSHSMNTLFPSGGTSTRLDALKAAVGNVADTLEASGETTPGSMLVSVVPYSSAVNVADTCDADPLTGNCRSRRSPGKERYLRMLTGVHGDPLRAAREVRDDGTGGHWVDTFHHYGAGPGLGALTRQYLPDALLDCLDPTSPTSNCWNLRRKDVAINVRDQAPPLGTWTVDDEDFWNGCVMARWGAYWNEEARPAGWTQDAAANWPATKPVAAWSPNSSALDQDTPLHLSDAPPNANDPNTLFTAFSWPDSRIAGRADGWLQDTMIELLHPGVARGYPAVHDNDWSFPGNGGNLYCPPVAIMPLTDDLDRVRAAADRLATTPTYSGTGATYMNLGIVWGLRALSPLWKDVWDVQDVGGRPRPAVPCETEGEPPGCEPSLEKSILLVSDGRNSMGLTYASRLRGSGRRSHNPFPGTEARCTDTRIGSYRAAAATATESAFNARFRTPHVGVSLVDAQGRLTPHGQRRFVDAFLRFAGVDETRRGYPAPQPATPASRAAMLNALGSADSGDAPTPWQLFRGRDADAVDSIMAQNAFGFDGRPTLVDHRCRPSSTFSPYGRADDAVYIGEVGQDALTPARPVADVAPFETASLAPSIVGDGSPGSFDRDAARGALDNRIDEWFLEACEIAGQRGVKINVVFIGEEAYYRDAIEMLEKCLDSAGGDEDEDEVFVTPTPDALTEAFEEIFTIRRNLRFLN